MKREIEKRLDAVEHRKFDWASQLKIVDFGILDDYTGDEWIELHNDQFLTVVHHKDTNEIRGFYFDRRSDEQIQSESGDLEYL